MDDYFRQNNYFQINGTLLSEYIVLKKYIIKNIESIPKILSVCSFHHINHKIIKYDKMTYSPNRYASNVIGIAELRDYFRRGNVYQWTLLENSLY